MQGQERTCVLPTGLVLQLLDPDRGEVLNEMVAQDGSTWMEFPLFQGEVGDAFQLRLSLAEATLPSAMMVHTFVL